MLVVSYFGSSQVKQAHLHSKKTSQKQAWTERLFAGGLRGEGIYVAIRWHLGNLNNTHVGAHPRIPRQTYIGIPMYGSWLESIHRRNSLSIGGWSIHQSSNVRTCIPTSVYDYTLPKSLWEENTFLMSINGLFIKTNG